MNSEWWRVWPRLKSSLQNWFYYDFIEIFKFIWISFWIIISFMKFKCMHDWVLRCEWKPKLMELFGIFGCGVCVTNEGSWMVHQWRRDTAMRKEVHSRIFLERNTKCQCIATILIKIQYVPLEINEFSYPNCLIFEKHVRQWRRPNEKRHTAKMQPKIIQKLQFRFTDIKWHPSRTHPTQSNEAHKHTLIFMHRSRFLWIINSITVALSYCVCRSEWMIGPSDVPSPFLLSPRSFFCRMEAHFSLVVGQLQIKSIYCVIWCAWKRAMLCSFALINSIGAFGIFQIEWQFHSKLICENKVRVLLILCFCCCFRFDWTVNVISRG